MKLTLKEMLPVFRAGSIEILNEINEPLLRIVDLTECVLRLDEALSDSLLSREVISSWGEGENNVVIKIKGEDDAE